MNKVFISSLDSIQPLCYEEPNTDELYTWLCYQRVIKVAKDELPQKFIDGTVLCKLINKLEGRNCKLGFHQNPKTLSACRANIKRALDYLKKFPKFKSEYLWSSEEIIHGNPDSVWGLLKDIKNFYPDYEGSIKSPLRSVNSGNRSRSVAAKSPVSGEKCDVETVKKWLETLGLRYMLDCSQRNYVKDPLRNGVLLCKVLNKVKEQFEYFSHPLNVEELWENLNTVVKVIKKEIKVNKVTELTDEGCVWDLLHRIMLTYKPKAKLELPYSNLQIRQLQNATFKWVYSLKPFDQTFPENFQCLVGVLKSGVILSRLVEKICNVSIEIIRYPSCMKECLMNLDLSLMALQKEENMSKGFVWDSIEIYAGNEMYILALLEDLHRFSKGLPMRKSGPAYHDDGPFFGSFGLERLNLAKTDEKSLWNSKSVYMSPSRQESVHKSFIGASSPASAYSYNSLKTSVEMSCENISPRIKPSKKLNLTSFEWIGEIMTSLPKTLDMTGEKISEFRSGMLLCEIMQTLEAKTIIGMQKAKKGTAAAVKNVSLVFDILRKKPNFSSKVYSIEKHVIDGNGHWIRLLLKEIYRLYKNSIVTLVKFRNSGKDLSRYCD